MIARAIHPLANIIPAMMDDAAVDLERDIQANGVRQPITVYQGMILDGRHRNAVCQKLGIEPKFTTFEGTEAEAKALVLSLNVHRRHLTFEQKQQVIEAELRRDPAQSNRVLAEKANVSHPTIAKVRAKLEGTGQLETVTSYKRVGADGKARKQPVKKATPRPAPAAKPDVPASSRGTASASWPRKSGAKAIAQAILDALGNADRARSVGRALQRLARTAVLEAPRSRGPRSLAQPSVESASAGIAGTAA